MYVTDCGPPDAPLYGSVIFSATTLNSTAVFACNASYYLVGNSSITCNANGMWSGNATCGNSGKWFPNNTLFTVSYQIRPLSVSGTYL